MGIPTDLVGRPELRARGADRRLLGRADRAAHDGLLRHRLPDRPQGLRRARSSAAWRAIRSRCWARCWSGSSRAFSSFWASAFKEVIVFTLIIPVLWWRSLTQPPRGGRGVTRCATLTPALCVARAARSCWRAALRRSSTVTLVSYIGLYAWSRWGWCMLTGVGGMTSFGQAAFVGLGAYATAWVCTSPAAAAASAAWSRRRCCHGSGWCSASRSPSSSPGASASITLQADGPLPAAVHDRLGPEPLLPVRQPRVPRRPDRHHRHARR